MDSQYLKSVYGTDYPAAVVKGGVRIPLTLETAFSRFYQSGDQRTGAIEVSRFMDGSASMTIAQLKREWDGLSTWQRVDFCNSCAWLSRQEDFPEIIRFVMKHGGPEEWSAIANKVPVGLPEDEAFGLLLSALPAMNEGNCSNVIQAIATTNHPDAAAVLRLRVERLWQATELWRDDSFFNQTAGEAVSCIEGLIELGIPPSDFEAHVLALAKHVCARNRDDCLRRLSPHYPRLQMSAKGRT